MTNADNDVKVTPGKVFRLQSICLLHQNALVWTPTPLKRRISLFPRLRKVRVRLVTPRRFLVEPITVYSALCTIIKAAKTGMLVTRNTEGNLHSRAMNPVNSKLTFVPTS